MKKNLIALLFCAICFVSCEKAKSIEKQETPGEEPGVLPPSSLEAGVSPDLVNAGYYETSIPTNADSSCVGRMVSAFPVTAALLTDGNRQYVGYYEGNHQMVIAQRTLPSGPWKYCRLDEFIDWDTHNYITMVKNRQGCLLISGNMHADPLVLFTTDESGEISTLRRVFPVVDASKEEHTTYPKFLFLTDGTLLFHYRDGKSGDGVEVYNKQNSDGSFSPYLDTPLIDGRLGGYNMSAYMQGPTLGPDGLYHLVWVWRDTSQADTCHDLSYAYSHDLKIWYGIDGKQLSMPMNFDQKQLIVDPIPTQGGINNSSITLGFDAQKRPMIGYYKFDEEGNSNVYIARLEDDGWNIRKVSDTQWRYYFTGTGSLIKQFTVGEPTVEADGSITIRYRRYNEDGSKIDGMEVWMDPETLDVLRITTERSTTSDYPSWAKKVMTPYDGEGSLKVNIVTDSGSSPTGARYLMRWDSLPNNRDNKPTVKIPEPSKLIVVKY